MMKKVCFRWAPLLGILFAVLLPVLAAGCSATPPADSAPNYSSTKARVLLSSKVDHLNEKQEASFWKLARRSAKVATASDGDWSKMKDVSLYVAKAKAKHTYQINYVAKATEPMKIKMLYRVAIKLKSAKLDGGQVGFTLLAHDESFAE